MFVSLRMKFLDKNSVEPAWVRELTPNSATHGCCPMGQAHKAQDLIPQTWLPGWIWSQRRGDIGSQAQ